MSPIITVIVISLAPFSAIAADVCNPAAFQGAYGFLMSGTTNISGDEKAVAAAGRIVFDGHGVISGEASVNFAGYLLGNPVTGSYELHEDCSIAWKLQDTSGAFQQFQGKVTPDGAKAQFHQSGIGGSQTGSLARVAPKCAADALAPQYTLTMAGSTTPMNTGEAARNVKVSGPITMLKNGEFSFGPAENAAPGSIHIDSNCVAEITLTLASATIHLRGPLVDAGGQILAIQTDPGAAVTARLTAVRPATDPQ